MLEFITTQTEDGILYHGARAFAQGNDTVSI